MEEDGRDGGGWKKDGGKKNDGGWNKALILCIARGKSYDAEIARQTALARAIKTNMADPECTVRVELKDS